MFNVLIADDEPFILEGLRYIVDWNALGLEIVASVSNGTEALEYIQQHSVHILLTDIRMPDMDGLTLIRQLREQNYAIHCIILSSYDDYQYLKEALQLKIDNYLIKSVNENELQETLAGIVQKLEQHSVTTPYLSENVFSENILLRWATGRIAPTEFEERMQFLKLPIGIGYFQVCILRFLEPNTKKVMRQLSDILAALSDFSAAAASHMVPDADYDLIFIYSGENKDELKELSITLTNRLVTQLAVPYLITIGQEAVRPQDVSQSYKTAKHLQNYCLTESTGSILQFNIPNPEHKKISSLTSAELELFYQSLLQSDDKKALSFLEHLYQKSYDHNTYAADYLQSTTIRLCFLVSDAVRYLYLNAPQLLTPTDLLYKQVSSFRSCSALYQWMSDRIVTFFHTKKEGTAIHSPIIERMFHYINAHYQENINLKSVSFALNCNTAYLGRIFKESTGQSFSSYLNQLRIEESKILLNETNCTVSEIAYKIGYNSTNYYVNIFKKYTGDFPAQYRSRHNS